MDEIPSELKYSKTHEWVKVEGNKARIGISYHAQKELTDVVFVELAKVGAELKKGGEIGAVESVKAVSELYSPVSGKVVEANDELGDSPELVNKEPYGRGWLVAVELKDKKELEQLMSAAQYKAMLSENKH